MGNFKKDQHNPRLMLDYDAIYESFGRQVVYYLDQVRDLYEHSPQKGRLRRIANLAWILMNQPADEDGYINLSLEDILNLLSDGKNERRISHGVLQSDMRELGASMGIRLAYGPKDTKTKNEKILIKPARIIKAK